MKTILYLFMSLVVINPSTKTEGVKYPKALVSYSDYENLVKEVKIHRQKRLLSFDEFLSKSQLKNVVILDTRSKKMFNNKHIKGAIHLNFSDFTQENLKKIIPDTETIILIYCNNNFNGDKINFASKIRLPKIDQKDIKPITLALNIPTYINLYGYGYKNVYELSELIYPFDKRITYEGNTIH